MKFKSIALAIVASMASTVAMADLYTVDLAAAGDRLLVVDSQTNLGWLNPGQTRGLSLDELNAAGWFDQGFSLATEAQVVNLMQSTSPVRALAALGGQFVPRTSGDVSWLVPVVVGAVAGNFQAPGDPILVRVFEYGPYLNEPQGAEPVSGDRGWACGPESEFACVPAQPSDPGDQDQTVNHEVFVTTLTTWFSTRDSTPGASVFLVKDVSAVPEPTTLLLMGVGLVGLFGASRRRQPN